MGPFPDSTSATSSSGKQVKFDDDSPMHARLERWAVGSEALSQSFMLRRRKLFDVEKGFDEEKRKVAEAVESALSMWSRCVLRVRGVLSAPDRWR